MKVYCRQIIRLLEDCAVMLDKTKWHSIVPGGLLAKRCVVLFPGHFFALGCFGCNFYFVGEQTESFKCWPTPLKNRCTAWSTHESKISESFGFCAIISGSAVSSIAVHELLRSQLRQTVLLLSRNVVKSSAGLSAGSTFDCFSLFLQQTDIWPTGPQEFINTMTWQCIIIFDQ